MNVRIYLTNLAKYNAGRLVGKWLALPLSDEELEKEMREVLGDEEEYFITDYEAPFKIDEYENLSDLNEFADTLMDLEGEDQQKVVLLISEIGYSKEEAFARYEDVVFYPGLSLEDVASELVEEGIFGVLNETIKSYIDYEKLAHDLSLDGYYETAKGTFWFQ